MVKMSPMQIRFIWHSWERTGWRGAVKMWFTGDMARCVKSGPASDITGLSVLWKEGWISNPMSLHPISMSERKPASSLCFREVLELLNVMGVIHIQWLFRAIFDLYKGILNRCLKKSNSHLSLPVGMWGTMTIRFSVDYLCILTSERQWLLPVILYVGVIQG